MHILTMAPYIFTNLEKCFMRNRTGFGIIVFKIASELSKSNSVFILTNMPHKGTKLGNLTLVKNNSLSGYLFSTFQSFDKWFQFVRIAYKQKSTIVSKLKITAKLLSTYYIVKIIHKINPDVIHIHGLSLDSLTFIRAAIISRKPFIIMLHGIGYLEDTGSKRTYFERCYKCLVPFLAEKGIHFSVINSWAKKEILSWPKCLNLNSQIDIIGHGMDNNIQKNIDMKMVNIKLKMILSTNTDKIKIINVGGLSKRKNQMLLLEAYKFLPKELKEKVVFLLIGRESKSEKNELIKFIKNNNLINIVYFCGEVNDVELNFIYKKCDYMVHSSREEGFGLPIIEAASFGVPCLFFSKIQSANDLSNTKANMTFDEINPKSLALAIIDMINKKWDTNEIIEYSKLFMWSEVKQNYLTLFNRAVKDYEFKISVDEFDKISTEILLNH